MQVEYIARYASFIVERREHVYTSNITRRLATANRSRVCICVTKFLDAETPPLGMEAWLTPRNTPLSTLPLHVPATSHMSNLAVALQHCKRFHSSEPGIISQRGVTLSNVVVLG